MANNNPRAHGTILRRPERMIEFTPEALAALPITSHHTDIWYDRDNPYLQVCHYNMKKGAVLRFSISNGYRARRGAAKKGIILGQYTNLGDDLSIEDARRLGAEAAERCRKWAENGAPDGVTQFRRKFRKQSSLPEIGPLNIQALLRDASAENPNMEKLWGVLGDAFAQASGGKGVANHGTGAAFEDQDMIHIQNAVGIPFALGQAIKKLVEGRRMSKAVARQEFLGAIVYIAGAIVWMDQQEK